MITRLFLLTIFMFSMPGLVFSAGWESVPPALRSQVGGLTVHLASQEGDKHLENMRKFNELQQKISEMTKQIDAEKKATKRKPRRNTRSKKKAKKPSQRSLVGIKSVRIVQSVPTDESADVDIVGESESKAPKPTVINAKRIRVAATDELADIDIMGG